MRYKPILIAGVLVAGLVAGFAWRGEWLIGSILRARFSPEVALPDRDRKSVV